VPHDAVTPLPPTVDCLHLDATSRFFRALSDPTRLKLLEFVLAGAVPGRRQRRRAGLLPPHPRRPQRRTGLEHVFEPA
jgi:hypothetical protein